MGFDWWNKQAGNLILGSRSYLTGKQGFLPDWQIKGMGLKEILAPEQFAKGGKIQRDIVLDRAGGWWSGITGTGGKGGKGGKIIDVGTDAGGGLINVTLPEIPPFPKIPDFPTLPPFPKIPDFPKIPEGGLVDLTGVSEGMSDFAMALGMGLGSLGQGIGGGMPQMPSMQLMDEEGTPNILLLGGLAGVAYIVLRRKS